jgi:hypothetical protein
VCQRLAIAVGAVVGLVACSSSDAEPARSHPPEGDRWFWVDPARCLAPCDHYPRDHLVGVDTSGAIDSTSSRRFAAHAQPALRALIASAVADGRNVWADSGFRTYQEQAAIYAAATEIGRAARPGHSEHQIGTAMDFGYGDDTDAEWLALHGWEHGFVQSYPPDQQKVTGFRVEAWHFRWVGHETAAEVHASGGSLSEWFRAHPEQTLSGDCSDCSEAASRSECGGLDAAGVCSGSVLRWCFDGALAEVDCALDGQPCAVTSTGADCE